MSGDGEKMPKPQSKSEKKSSPVKKEPEKKSEETNDIWKEVRRRGKNTTSKNKENKEKEIRIEREELDFQFDEELDMPIGRNNQFSTDW